MKKVIVASMRECRNFGNGLKKIRESEGLTQREFAEILDIPKSSYSEYERGVKRPNVCAIEKICKSLDMSIYKIMEYANEEQKNTAKHDESEVLTTTEKLVQKAFDMSLEIVRDRNSQYGDSWKDYRKGTYIDRAVVKTRRLRNLDEQGLEDEKLLDQALDLINELAFLVIKIKGWDK